MEQILRVKNFNAYTGRYSRRRRARSIEKKTGWYVHDLFAQIVPVLALRALGRERELPLAWENDRHLRHGIDLTLSALKSWQAFRPFPSEKVIKKLTRRIPRVVGTFQRTMRQLGVRNLWHLGSHTEDVLVSICTAVQQVSSLKNPWNPMLGSKVLHFLIPEFFPAWDTEWVKRKCLRYESLEASPGVAARLVGQPAAIEYARYVSLLIAELERIPTREYRRLKETCLCYSAGNRSSAAWPQVIEWYFSDIAPILFEICLLGKHCAKG